MKLIRELHEDVAPLIVESKSTGKNYFFEGIFLQSEIKNRNGRKYGQKMLEEEVNRYISEKVAQMRAVGELGHPPTPTINYERASHQILEMSQQGNNWVGKAKVLTSLPYGAIVKGLIDEGVRFGVSSRGLGTLKTIPGGVTEVHNYRISTAADIVADPSAPDAFVTGVMEGADWVYDAATDSWHAQTVLEQTVETFKQQKASTITEEQKLKAFNAFISSLSQK